MRFLKWLPWKWLIRYVSRTHGFVDPISLLGQLHGFAQPSEVAEPLELLRAGVVFHARGLINTRAIQHNLDWVWPYWVHRQFDPNDVSFIPRAFSVTHVNLTHRNWTGVGLPGNPFLPIVDPRGLVTPHWDGWSIDLWLFGGTQGSLVPARMKEGVGQRMVFDTGCAVETSVLHAGARLVHRLEAVWEGESAACMVEIDAESMHHDFLVVSIRPANPEGVSLVNQIEYEDARRKFLVNGTDELHLSESPERVLLSNYREGDVFLHLGEERFDSTVSCDVGLATAAAIYPLGETAIQLGLRMPARAKKRQLTHQPWVEAVRGVPELRVPSGGMGYLFAAAIRSLLCLQVGDGMIYPGPYTYRRFWYRDASFMVYAMLVCGRVQEARRIVERFPDQQTHTGFFHSQDGEWDSNGEVLWVIDKLRRFQGAPLPEEWKSWIFRGADWICQKRLKDAQGALHEGLLPAGFSAEHLGPNDYYYWDDFWGVAGLRAAADIAAHYGENERRERYREEADDLLAHVDRSIAERIWQNERKRIPASPYRRMDAGAIGSIVASYPLRLTPPRDERVLGTVEYLLRESVYQNGFFQDMIHSGTNPYLTLHIAQVLLRAGDRRYWPLVERVAELASPTGQWPEAIHPRTGGGCMGDGHHGWASAEWIVMMRNLFVREENDSLVLGSGIPEGWLARRSRFAFGPVHTEFGEITIRSTPNGDREITWEPKWHRPPDRIIVAIPGYRAQELAGDATRAVLEEE